jgi:Flp pilus assembly protein TadB
MEDDDTHLGAKFWLGLIGVTLALAVGALILFLFVDVIWYLWGAIGALLFVFFVAGAIGYIHDRREQRRYERLPA